jgi:hypothetical protein
MKALAESTSRPPGAPTPKPGEADRMGGRVETPDQMPASPVGFLGTNARH